MILTFRAKVLLSSEDQMEMQAQYDLGDITNKDEKKWVWRNIAVPAEEIFRLIEYNSTKTLIKMYDEELVMVSENFQSVYDKWQEAVRSSQIDFTPDYEEEGQEENNKEEEE